ncbi:MAG: HAD family phosphatase [Victivallales bacterium]|nr:HAD family phosphatase [Victivallales bacterium]
MKSFLIFDMDGVLLDTMPLWEHLGIDYLTAHGIQPTPGLRERLLQMTMPEAAELFRAEFGMTAPAEEIIDGIDAMAKEFYTAKALLKLGVAETLAELHRRGYHCVLATATDRDLATAALRRTGIESCFQQIFTCTELNLSKQDPAFYLAILQELKTSAGECAVIEDALHAIQTALACGIDTYAIYDESAHDVWPQIQSIATCAFQRFDQLLEVL